MRILLILTISFIMLFANDTIKETYSKSFEYEKMGNYKEAIKILQPLYQKYPKGYTLNLRLGWLFFLSKRYNNALKHYQKASLILPSSFEPRLGICRVYLATQYWEKAKIISYSILKEDPLNYYANLYATQALIKENNFKDAQYIIRKMLIRYPTDISFLELKAYIESIIDIKLAINTYNTILTLDPNNVLATIFFKKIKKY